MRESKALHGLITEKFGMRNGINLNFENISCHRVKDSYDDVWEEFLEEGLQAALTHAKQELETASAANTSLTVRKNHLKRACKDLRNYLTVANRLADEYESTRINPQDHKGTYGLWDRDAKKLIEALASFREPEIDECLTDLIWSRYSSDDQICDLPGFCPDYGDLYANIGDIALFCEGDVDRAMLWYALVPIDWENINEEVDDEIGFRERKIKAANQWWENFNRNIEQISSLANDDVFHMLIVGTEELLNLSDLCKGKLHDYLVVWGNYQEGVESSNPDAVWEAAENYINAAVDDVRDIIVNEENRKIARTEVAIAWIIYDQAKYYRILSLAEDIDNVSPTDKDKQIIMEALSDNRNAVDKIRPVQKMLIQIKTAVQENGTEIEDGDITSLLYLVRAVLDCDKILHILNTGIFSGKVAYYTSMNTLMKMLPETADAEENIGHMAIMHVAYMNDPNEGRVLSHWIMEKKSDRNGNGREKADYPFVFIKCFTTRIDDLPMWEMYGDHAQGCCIVIDMEKLMKGVKKVFPVYNVCYLSRDDEKEYEICEKDNVSISPEGVVRIGKLIADLKNIRGMGKSFRHKEAYWDVLEQILSRVTYLFKNADYSYECEKRIIYNAASGMSKKIRHSKVAKDGDTPLLYMISDVPIRIEEVILGSKYKDASWKMPYLQESLEKMCKKIGINETIGLSYSAIEYR